MPEPTPPAAPEAEKTGEPKPDAKPSRAKPQAEERAPEPARRARPEDAMVVSALLDLHRTVEARGVSTIRGRSPAIGNRYLKAAEALGDELVVAILGPAKG